MALVKADPFRIDLPELFSWLRLPEYRLAPELVWPGATMRIEEFTENGTHVIRAELPGVDVDEDVEVSVADGMLTIRAERSETKEEGDGKHGYRSEFRYGSLVRTVSLPAGVDESDVQATYENGILEVRVPVGQVGHEPRKVAITRH